MTRAVAGKDLRVLWASPVPFVVGALFHVALGMLYVSQLEVRRQAVIQPLVPLAGFLLILTVPVLAMRSVAEEARVGTLDLLRAIPVAPRSLAAGKWVATWVSTLAVLAPALLFVVLLSWWGDPDTGPVVAGFLGLALLAAALAGLGVAASALTSSQPVAAMTALFVALLLWFADVGTDRFGLSGLRRLSLSDRLRSFAGGAVDSGDVVFLLAVAAGGVVVAAAAIDARRLR